MEFFKKLEDQINNYDPLVPVNNIEYQIPLLPEKQEEDPPVRVQRSYAGSTRGGRDGSQGSRVSRSRVSRIGSKRKSAVKTKNKKINVIKAT